MIGQAFRRLRDTFAAGSAEREFRRMTAECRQLMHEMEAVMEKMALRAATEAKRRSREAQRSLQAEEHVPPAVAAPVDDLRARKSALRQQFFGRGIPQIPQRTADG